MSEISTSSKDKILLAAIEEFGEHGYKHASTNNIVQRAGLSKGLIFHYFQNKEKLHFACMEYAIDVFNKFIKNENPCANADYFDRLLSFSISKLKFTHEHLLISRMFSDAYLLFGTGKMPHFANFFDNVTKQQWNMLVEGVDTSHFKQNIPIDMMLDYVHSALDTLAQKYIRKYITTNEVASIDQVELIKEVQVLVNFIKYGVYVEEL